MSNDPLVRLSTKILGVGSLLLGTLFLVLALSGRAPSMAAFVGTFLIASGAYQLLALAYLPERHQTVGTHDHAVAEGLKRVVNQSMPLLPVAGVLWFAAAYAGIDSPLISALFLTATASFLYRSWTIVSEHGGAQH